MPKAAYNIVRKEQNLLSIIEAEEADMKHLCFKLRLLLMLLGLFIGLNAQIVDLSV